MWLSNTPKILIVNPYGIGDSLFSTPLIRTLHETYPKATLGILLGSRTEDIFSHNPHIHAIFTYKKDYLRSLSLLKRMQYIAGLLLQIKKQKFDILIDLSNTDEYAFFAKFFWHIPIRIGFNYKKRGQFLNYKIKIPQGFSRKHVSDYYNSLLAFLDIDFSKVERKLDFYIDPKSETWLNSFTQEYHIRPSDILICILPGGGASWGNFANVRYWPSAYYGQLANRLIEQYKAKIFIIGSLPEKELAEEVIRSIKYPVHNLCGETSLHELAQLMSKSHLVIGTESGPLHLTTALDCPSVVIYGPVSEVEYGPYSMTCRQKAAYLSLPCHPCYRNFRMSPCTYRLCLSELTPSALFSQACEILEKQLNKKDAGD